MIDLFITRALLWRARARGSRESREYASPIANAFCAEEKLRKNDDGNS